MSPFQEKLYRRVMLQLSDVPWLAVAWVLGLAAEGALLWLGISSFSPSWGLWLKVAAVYAALGYMGFVFNRRLPGFAAGATIGLAYELIIHFLYPLQAFAGAGATAGFRVAMVVWCAVLPFVVDSILDPWLLRGGPLRRLASHHPRYDHLRE